MAHLLQNPTQEWIKNLNIRPETIKLLEENIGDMLCYIGLGKNILDKTPKAQVTKVQVDK